jgi:hypothetical protein
MRYALLICNDENAVISPEEQSRRAAAFTSFREEMEARGVLLGSVRLRPTTMSTTVQVRDGDLAIADGPFAETKERIAGFYLIDCTHLDEAIKVAAKVPAARYGTVEVRPVWEMRQRDQPAMSEGSAPSGTSEGVHPAGRHSSYE